MEIERADYRELYRTKPLTEMFTEWHPEGSRNFHQTAYRTEYRAIIPEAHQMTFTEKRLPRLYQMPNQEMPKSAYAMYKAAVLEQKRARITVSMTTYCQAYVLDMDQ